MLVSFNPDENKASIWQFEQVKSNAQLAHYVLVHRLWLWDRIEKNLSEEGWISFENCSYLAFGANNLSSY